MYVYVIFNLWSSCKRTTKVVSRETDATEINEKSKRRNDLHKREIKTLSNDETEN